MRKASVPAAFLFALILAVPAFSQSSTPPPSAALEALTSEALLQRAHDLLPSLSPLERLAVLRRLADASGRKHPENARLWLDEAFVIASQLPDPRRRAYFQITLLDPLSDLDQRAALEKLAVVEPPLHPGDYDPRDAASTWIFLRLYREHPADVEKIIEVARHIGDTGTYPFAGVYSIFSELVAPDPGSGQISKEKQQTIAIFIQDAVRYFKLGRSSDQANEQFAHFLKGYAQFMPPELVDFALQELVSRLQEAPQAADQQLVTMVSGHGDFDAVITRNRNDILLAELLPLVRAVDPALEQKLRQAPDVGRVAGKLEGSGLAVLGAYNRGPNDDRTIQELQVGRAQMLSWQQPEQAVKALDEVSNPDLHATAAAKLALAFKDTNPQESSRLLAQAWQTLEKTEIPMERLTILYQMTHTLASMDQQEQLAVAVDQSFAAASNALRLHVAPVQLAKIVQTSAPLMPEHLLDKINDVRSSMLQAVLLIALAKGLETEEYPARKPKTSIGPKQ